MEHLTGCCESDGEVGSRPRHATGSPLTILSAVSSPRLACCAAVHTGRARWNKAATVLPEREKEPLHTKEVWQGSIGARHPDSAAASTSWTSRRNSHSACAAYLRCLFGRHNSQAATADTLLRKSVKLINGSTQCRYRGPYTVSRMAMLCLVLLWLKLVPHLVPLCRFRAHDQTQLTTTVARFTGCRSYRCHSYYLQAGSSELQTPVLESCLASPTIHSSNTHTRISSRRRAHHKPQLYLQRIPPHTPAEMGKKRAPSRSKAIFNLSLPEYSPRKNRST